MYSIFMWIVGWCKYSRAKKQNKMYYTACIPGSIFHVLVNTQFHYLDHLPNSGQFMSLPELNLEYWTLWFLGSLAIVLNSYYISNSSSRAYKFPHSPPLCFSLAFLLTKQIFQVLLLSPFEFPHCSSSLRLFLISCIIAS